MYEKFRNRLLAYVKSYPARREEISGRAVTLTVKGGSFHFGAYAIYGRNPSVLHKLVKRVRYSY